MTSKRDISATNETAILSKRVRPILFARLDFLSGVKRYHTQIGPRTAVHPIHGSESYDGIGDWGGIASDVTESVGNATYPVKLAITAAKSALVSDALTDDYFGRDAELMLGFDDATATLEDDPVILWSGFMDKVDITMKKGVAQMLLTCESRGTRLQQSSDLRFTDEDLQAVFSGDLAGEYIFRMIDLQLRWGDASFRSPLGSGALRGRRRRDSRR